MGKLITRVGSRRIEFTFGDGKFIGVDAYGSTYETPDVPGNFAKLTIMDDVLGIAEVLHERAPKPTMLEDIVELLTPDPWGISTV